MGALIHDSTDKESLGNTLAYIGIGYAAISFIILTVALYKKANPHIGALFHEREKSKAYEDILKWKKLLDENIITQEEYEAKTRELKGKIL